jgi:methanogen homocitrate synthase
MKKFEEVLLGSSPLNLMPEVRKEVNAAQRIIIHDSTLRDGEQTAGVVINKDEKVKIGKALDEYGVDRIEIMPAVSNEDVEAIQEMLALGIKAEVVGFCRALQKDIDKSLEAGCKAVQIELPAYPRLLDAMGMDLDAAVEFFIKASSYAKEKGLRVSGFFMMATQAPEEFSLKLVENISKRDALDAISIPDTLGMALPWSIYHFIKKIKQITDKQVEIHPHNPLGMATANALAGIMAGAEVVHTCMNGLGDAGGNAPLESVAVAMELMLGIQSNLKLEKTYEVSNLVKDLTGYTTPGNCPIVGDLAFSTESGIGIDMGIKLMGVQSKHPMFKDIPSMVGRKRTIVIGKGSGRKSIVLKSLMLGINQVDEEKQKKILQIIKNKSIELHRTLTDDEFKEIVLSNS